MINFAPALNLIRNGGLIMSVKKDKKDEVLYTVEEAASKIRMNPEVLRRKLRQGIIFGVKLTPKMWKIPEDSIINYMNHVDNLSKQNVSVNVKTSENCSRFPRWIEYSGLPGYLSQKFGVATWLVMKKIVELDCFENEKAGVFFEFKMEEMGIITGLTRQTLHKAITNLRQEKYIEYVTTRGKNAVSKFKILTPLRTPVSIYEIPEEHGGVKGRLKSEVLGTCITRFF